MTSQNDLKKLRALDDERVALEQKQAEARAKFAGKIGSSLLRSLGDDDAAAVTDKLAKMSKSQRSEWIKTTLKETRQQDQSTDAKKAPSAVLNGTAAMNETAPGS